MSPTRRLMKGDCIEKIRSLPDNSVDSIVTDPPYGLGFMGKTWDDLPPGEEWARECLRVLKPGGHILAFGGSRTFHRLAVAIEDAGFEIRDSIAWLYGSGFPKSMDVSKAIDKAAGAERAKVQRPGAASAYSSNAGNERPWMDLAKEQGFIEVDGGTPVTAAAAAWQGWGTALKPAFEPIVVGRKPLVGTVAANVLVHGTGALNIDATRIATTDKLGGGAETKTTAAQKGDEGWTRPWMDDEIAQAAHAERVRVNVVKAEVLGRWPANVILDESQAEVLDKQSGVRAPGNHPAKRAGDRRESVIGLGHAGTEGEQRTTEAGGASRFFYVAKAPKKERPVVDGTAHPTVKPLALMRWLVRLVTPPGGTVLEPFTGSGTTVEACLLEGFGVIAIEREEDYFPLIRERIRRAKVALGEIEE